MFDEIIEIIVEKVLGVSIQIDEIYEQANSNNLLKDRSVSFERVLTNRRETTAWTTIDKQQVII